MKKLILLVAILIGGSLSAQDMKTLKEAPTKSTATSKMGSEGMITQLAGDQVKAFTKNFGLSDAQAGQVSELITRYLKSPKFESLLSKYSPERLLSPNGTNGVKQALLSDPNFMKDVKGMVSEEQFAKMGKSVMKKG